jgi:hypothetical protein
MGKKVRENREIFNQFIPLLLSLSLSQKRATFTQQIP